MYNMCTLSPTRQEAAALAGMVPLLVKLATPSPHDAQPPSPPPLKPLCRVPHRPLELTRPPVVMMSPLCLAEGRTPCGPLQYPYCVGWLTPHTVLGMSCGRTMWLHCCWICSRRRSVASVYSGFHADINLLLLAATGKHCSDARSAVCVAGKCVAHRFRATIKRHKSCNNTEHLLDRFYMLCQHSTLLASKS